MSTNASNPRGHRPGSIKRRVAILLGALVALALLLWLLAGPLQQQPFAGWFGGGRAADPADQAAVQWYTCPMHPDVLQKEPGRCPICGMDLVPVKDAPTSEAAQTEQATTSPSSETPHALATAPNGKTLYTCGMHPQVLQEEPGVCPICHMDLTPVHVGAEETPGATQSSNEGPVVRIDPVMVQNMNVVEDTARVRDLRRSIRTVGYLDYDQEKMVSVTTKYSGFVEKVHVNYLGQPVVKGEALFDVYSPELVQTQQELLSALEYVRKMQDAPDDSRARAQALLDAVRARLAFWDVTPEQVRHLERNGTLLRTLAVVAPAQGLVMKRMEGLEGMAIKPGMDVMHIADISSLWVNVEVYESQLPWVNTGSTARIRLTYFPGEAFEGRVRFVEPQVTEKTRTIRLTLEVPNRDHRLRAGMYTTVEFEPVVASAAVTVPSQAVIRTGERNILVVALGDGRFAPRDVELGLEGDGYVQVLSGLEPNERIVTSAQFLIDSESNIRAAIQKMVAGHAH